ncbi:MAG: hypothetical protein Q4B43_03740 [Bacteroidota bacterium]|nr:hypothetical protein [Bacteroidota bacterium]
MPRISTTGYNDVIGINCNTIEPNRNINGSSNLVHIAINISNSSINFKLL